MTYQAILRALVAFERFRSPKAVTAALQNPNPAFLEVEFKELPTETRVAICAQAETLHNQNVVAINAGDNRFPSSLMSAGRPIVPTLFCKGEQSLLQSPAAGMCGSRNASPLGLKAARACGEEVSCRGLTVVSGYAKGVDTQTHLAALAHEGATVIVLAEGISRFRVKRDFREAFDPKRVLVVSQFHPTQSWASYAAMARNRVIFGLSRALVVIEAGEKGGTLAAGRDAMKAGRPVFVLNFGDDTPPGNRLLIDSGARAVSSRRELGTALDELNDEPQQGVLL
ncbi:hypothetical protein B1R94_08645 [Mycolicibacterium litorale]|nr:hypothetical protein B1R94_08645 [Mycolicibacterium litorale]